MHYFLIVCILHYSLKDFLLVRHACTERIKSLLFDCLALTLGQFENASLCLKILGIVILILLELKFCQAVCRGKQLQQIKLHLHNCTF